MASGKTTVGTALARRLGWRYRDNDDLLVELAGATANELNRRVGADELHRLEADSVLAVLDDPGPSVVGAAASTIEDERFRAALATPGVFVVWLQGDPAQLALRMPSGVHRPALAADLARLLTNQLQKRRPLFESVADLVIPAAGSTADEVAATIATAVSHDRVPKADAADRRQAPGPGRRLRGA